jgi:Fe-S cluster assembly protein SufD
MAAPKPIPDALDGYRQAFTGEVLRRREPLWLQAARRHAFASFERQGFPTTRDEDWRFTNVAPIAEGRFAPGAAVQAPLALAEVPLVPGLPGPVLVFVDGRFAPDLSRGASLYGLGAVFGSLAHGLREAPETLQSDLAQHAASDGRPFVALNTALFEDGAFVRVPDGVIVEGAVQVVFVATGREPGTSTHPRVLLVAGANSQVRLVESFVSAPGAAPSFTNAVTEIVAGDAAVVEHYRIQREGESAFHIGQTQLRVGRSTSVASHAVTLGAALSRHDAVAVLAAEGADCTLNGLYLARGTQLVDNHTEIDHAMPHGSSHEIYKGILADRARGVFNGRIRVRPDAQKTDAKQTNKTLLLSDEAQVNTKPQLEIFANDVKCTHGATVGQLSQEALFYLRARGIGAADARKLLVRAFAMDILSHVRLEPVRAELDRLLAERLPGADPDGGAA